MKSINIEDLEKVNGGANEVKDNPSPIEQELITVKDGDLGFEWLKPYRPHR